MSLRFALAALLTALSAAPAFAQPVRLIGEFRDWTAYSAAEGAGALCFMMSTARETAPEPDGFTAAHLYITSRPREGLRDEFNLIAGFNFAPDSPASVSVGGTSFPLFTERDAAWLLDPAQSGNLAGAMRAGSALVVEATSERGIKVKQTFSLSGATAAYRALEGC
jgi:hypothetical protein